MLHADPISTKSRTDKVDPSLDIPYTDMFDPRRKKERRLMDEPIHTKSSTLRLDPMRVIPYMLIDDPRRTNDRRLIDEPS